MGGGGLRDPRLDGLIVAASADKAMAVTLSAALIGVRGARLAPPPLGFDRAEGREAGRRAVREAGFVALIVSEASLSDRWVRFAAEAARSAGVPLIPLLTEPVAPRALLWVTGGAEPIPAEPPFQIARDAAALLARLEALDLQRAAAAPAPVYPEALDADVAEMETRAGSEAETVEIGGVAVAPSTASDGEDRYHSAEERVFDSAGDEALDLEGPDEGAFEAAGAARAEPAPAAEQDRAASGEATLAAAPPVFVEPLAAEAPESVLREAPPPAPPAPAEAPLEEEAFEEEALEEAPPEEEAQAAPPAAIEARPARLRRIAELFRTAHLFENAPRKMRKHHVEEITVRLSRDKAGGAGMSGAVERHQILAASAMTVELDDPTFSYSIRPRTPATQWVDREGLSELGLPERPAEWRWAVEPLKTGVRPLHIRASARVMDSEGGAAEEALPEQVIEVTVRVDPRQTLNQAARWTLFGFVAGVIGHYAEVIVEASRTLAGLQ